MSIMIIWRDKGEDEEEEEDDTDKDANEYWSNQLSTNIVLLGMSMTFDYPTNIAWIICIFLLKFYDKFPSVTAIWKFSVDIPSISFALFFLDHLTHILK